MKIGVLGANGFLGTEMVNTLAKNHCVISITRDNYLKHKGEFFDVFINVAGNKLNYWANKFPQEDFKISTLLVYESLFDFKIDQYIFMSSIAAYDIKSHYGFNKFLSEEIIKRHSKNYLIFRCCSVIDKNMDVGIINDMLKGVPLFVSGDSLIQFITKEAVAIIINDLISTNIKNKLFNMGGIGAVKIEDLSSVVDRPLVYQKGAQKRHYEMDVYELGKAVNIKTSYDYVNDIICL